jgi:hypothetical protein
MSSLDKELLRSFIEESKTLALRLDVLLADVESDLANSGKLEEYGNLVDRVMGGAQSLSLQLVNYKPLIFIGDLAALCKAVSYKASQVKNNDSLVEISVALLLDATEVLNEVLEDLSQSEIAIIEQNFELKKRFSQHFIDRLKWISSQFAPNLRATVGVSSEKPPAVNEIDMLLKKMGLG